MYWLLLPLAATTLYFGLRAPAPASMALWLLLTAIMIAAWVWLRYRSVFPNRRNDNHFTPLDPDEIERMRQQTLANRTAALADRPYGFVPPASAIPEATPEPHVTARPFTGRAVYDVPDDPPLP